jgi:DNA-binding CsgD family transcriptional regulator
VNRDSSADEKARPIYLLLQDMGLLDGAIFRVPAPLGRELTLVFYRERGARSFGANDQATLRLIYPHLAVGLGTRSALLAFGGDSADTFDELIDADQPHALVSLSREEASWSRSARSLVGRTLGELGRAGIQKLDRALVRLAREFGARPHTHLERSFLPGVRVEFARLPATKRNRAEVLALFFEERADEHENVLGPRNAVEELLTPTERRVTRAAAAGRSTRQIARKLRISVETVRTHLKHVYLKLGVRSRAELARALAG